MIWKNNEGGEDGCQIGFQTGTVSEAGVKGVSCESLLAIVADRLIRFQASPFACHQNETALSYVNGALGSLADRTRERQDRNVEGKHEV